MNWGDHEPSQSCGPPTREGATLDAPLPESATLSDMCVNGPIVYEWLDSVQRSQVHLLQRHAPEKGAILCPRRAGPGVRQSVSHVRENGWMSYVCLAACVTGSVWDWLRTRAETEGRNKKFNILTRNKIEKRNNVASYKFQESKFCLNRLILISLKEKKEL